MKPTPPDLLIELLDNSTFLVPRGALSAAWLSLFSLDLMAVRALNTLSVVALALSHLSAAPLPDAAAIQLLVGTWVVPRKEYTGTSKDGGFTFRADGTFSSFGVYRFGEQDVRIEVEGKWRIKHGVLIEELTKSNQPLIVPVGALTRDTLLTVTKKQYRFRTDRAVEHTYIRR